MGALAASLPGTLGPTKDSAQAESAPQAPAEPERHFVDLSGPEEMHLHALLSYGSMLDAFFERRSEELAELKLKRNGADKATGVLMSTLCGAADAPSGAAMGIEGGKLWWSEAGSDG